MRRVLACGALGLVLLSAACSGDATGSPGPTPGAPPDLTAESERMVAELAALESVTGADVQLRTGATSGRQVTIDAVTSAAGSAAQRDVLTAVTEVGWHTTAFVPTEVRATLVGPDGVTLDPRDLGFPRRGADSAGLYAMFGAPAADEDWQP